MHDSRLFSEFLKNFSATFFEEADYQINDNGIVETAQASVEVDALKIFSSQYFQ